MAGVKEYPATVEKIVRDGKHGPYAVAYSPEMGSVTFALDCKVVAEDDWPERGTRVMLSEVRQKKAGWRAQEWRYTQPSDTKQC